MIIKISLVIVVILVVIIAVSLFKMTPYELIITDDPEELTASKWNKISSESKKR